MKDILNILDSNVNPWVFGFFAFGGLLLLFISAFYILRHKNKTFLSFGIGLSLTGVAFLCWAYVTGFRPISLGLFTSIGVLLFMVALTSFFYSYVSTIRNKINRRIHWVLWFILITTFIALRFVFYESNPGFSDDGFFSFNINQIVVYAYVVLLAFSLLPAVYSVASKIKSPLLADALRFGFSLISIGTAILITSPDNYMQIINGVGMTVVMTAVAIAHALIGVED